MGYYASNPNSALVIKASNIAAALAAIKAMYETEDGLASPKYSWVDRDTVLKSETIEEALAEWRWDASLDEGGDLYCVTFSGEKLGDDEDLWFNLAPFIEHGGFIEMLGEDDNRWRWVFWRGEMRTEYPTIIWDYERITPAMELAEVIGEELAETA